MENQVREHCFASEAKDEEVVTAKKLHDMIIRQRHQCNLSGLPLTVDHAALDHITPISEGGAHKMSNLQWLDPRINSMKGTMNQTEFMILCEAITQKT